MAEPLLTKAELRAEMRRRLARVSPEELAEASLDLCRAVLAHESWAGARVVGLFAGMARLGEPDLTGLLAGGPACAFPRVDPATGVMEFCLVASLAELTLQEITLPGGKCLSLWQPDPRLPVMDVAQLDLVLVPGLAFTRDGLRLGRGGGFYDRALARMGAHTIKLGLALDCQIVDALPVEPHDQPLDGVLTPPFESKRF